MNRSVRTSQALGPAARCAAGWLCLSALALAVACAAIPGSGERDECTAVVLAYANALQDAPRPGQRVFDPEKQVAGLRRAYQLHVDSRRGVDEMNFVKRLKATADAYLVERERGKLDFDPDGVKWIYASQLANGRFMKPLSVEHVDKDHLVFHTQFNFGYHSEKFAQDILPGVTIYLLGAPLGTIYPVELGSGIQPTRMILLDCLVDFHLVRMKDADGKEVLLLESVEPIVGSEHSIEDPRQL